MENEYRSYKGLDQRRMYDGDWAMPRYFKDLPNKWYVKPGELFGGYFYSQPGPDKPWSYNK